MQRRRCLIAGGTVLTTALGGCAGSDPDYEEGNGDSSGGTTDDDGDGTDESEVEADVEILEHELVRENEGEMFEEVSVEGRAENTADDAFSYVEIRVRFYNENGDVLESFIDNINDFSSGQTWAFDVMYPGIGEDAQEIADYDIAVGTSF